MSNLSQTYELPQAWPEFVRVSEGFCPYCPNALQRNKHFDTDYGACKCCGLQFYAGLTDGNPHLGHTGWPESGVPMGKRGACEHMPEDFWGD